VGRRLEFIDFRLYWEGHVNRGDLVSFFGVSVPQASSDLAEYQEAAKGNAVYDKTRKTYVAGKKFKPVFFKPSADEYLAQLRLLHAGLLTEQEAWAVPLPSYSIVPILRRRLEPVTLRRILDAIRTRSTIHINYQSKSSPKPKWRWIAPHALAFDGSRWHARAWCYEHQEFRDFVLARILEVGEVRPDDIDGDADLGWKREVTLKLAPHPRLKGGARLALELDYGIIDGMIEISMRVCLAYYFIFHLRLDEAAVNEQPEGYGLVLVNKDEVDAAIKEAGRC
jgi:hypothetical protein